ncbi:glycosyltransferase [Elizabethkingia meningoseptica]|uniref:glycosyltransferase n=1 Tax=Elizabethkingia meningoseptica TaxID=238 RepID=UPI0023B05AF9|nr:glycosyltransferase [Elizabethkingia meningoseptica]MDE5438578.1 glycosyltransferase [Elizabethkingia meningoseptica]MDE5507649.1 glycosyltransferase [Elizabethkingia meningoseptica]MDE5516501.1 glycosyltransferase [Elizabethkingia meningoseptica]MDE5526746.1 glycosyltransferase [Elizabethkingia meningoseptica]MDE5530752.1 glycosyltransferase [Elizabethkingia meningoseptica]
MTKRKIVIVTEGFPYWAKENFLAGEISCLNDNFSFALLPLIMPKDRNLQLLPDNVQVLSPILKRNYFFRLLQGIFNLSPIRPFIIDFPNIFKDRKGSVKDNFIKWITTMVNSRALLASDQIRRLRKEPNTAIYLYWCNYPVKLFEKFPNRIFARVHGTEFAKITSDYIPMHIDKLSIADNTLYIPISIQAAEIIYNHTPVKYKINRLGVFPNQYQKDDNLPSIVRIVSVAYLIPKKRIHLIIEALKLVKDIEIEWIHFGDGPLWDDINNMSNRLSENIKVKLMGFVSNMDILKFYNENYVDLFINVSEIEGVPVSIMEALSFGIPVFATNVGGTREIVNNENGQIVASDFTSEELANFITNIRNYSSEKNFRKNALLMWEKRSNAEKNYKELIEILNS